VIFDGRNIYDEKAMATHGFTYFGSAGGSGEEAMPLLTVPPWTDQR